MAKAKSPTQIQYYKERARIQHAIRRLVRQGYIVNYELPAIPKKITSKSVASLSKITPTTIRKKSQYVSQETGEVKSGTQAFKEQRSESARKAARTRKWAKEQQYESFESQYFPQETKITTHNIVSQIAKYILDEEDLNSLLSYIVSAPTDARWYPRKQPAKRASKTAIDRLVNFISVIKEDGTVNTKTNESEFNEALENTLFAYDEEQVKINFIKLMGFLTGGPLSAQEVKDLSEEELGYL